jgi:tRNA threonylcarbamoyladenosine biosynthesis protein TsaB
MLILTIRTDKPDAEVGLYEDFTQLIYETWPAHRELSATLHTKIEQLLRAQHKDWNDLQGVVCYKGPGSFTGLRIGLTVANSLAYGLTIPVVGETNDWIERGIRRLLNHEDDGISLPEYGAPVHITERKR